LTIPKTEGVAAGLAVFQNDRHHYFFGVQKNGNQTIVFLEQANGRDQAILATKPIQDSDVVTLRVAANQDRCSFDFKTQSGDWQRLVTDADAKLLTTDVAGGFVGATVGPYATLKDPIQLVENMDSYNKSIPHQFASTGENPILRDVFTADPAPLVVGDTLYVYVGHDDAHGDQMFNMPEWLCYSTKDMKNWTAHGPVLNPPDFDWSDGSNTAWAAQVVENNGKFYYYVTVMHDPKHGHSANAIGVAVSESPTGPFTDARGTALITDEMTPESKRWGEDIDPTVYIDDGTPWLCWGNSDCYLVKLKKNMIELDGSIVKIDLPNYTEGPWLHKRGEIYYLTYAMQLPGVVPEQIGYATASVASGPWTYRGKVTGPAKNSFTIHPGIVEFKDQWYFFYHNAALILNGEGGALGRRAVCVEYLFYNPDGGIHPITQNIEGISLPPLKPQFLVSSSNESQE
jgi:beta-xylosidase